MIALLYAQRPRLRRWRRRLGADAVLYGLAAAGLLAGLACLAAALGGGT